ncbi:MAG TPA: helix-turn-helix domain-containing protein [Candidatus Saccharimonadales bacterium]|nr:helix-turn-helix domain-containing protein [Candidatus Saccharimonadales bacterium]
MSEESKQQPFRSLGIRLKTIRQKLQESVAEVSGAIEIDEAKLQRIEQGQERPSEDILLLLISHFGMHEDEAANLWLLAGYDRPEGHNRDDDASGRPTIMLMGIDPRVIYSDSVHISVNPSGVVMGFSQSGGPANQPLAIARIGMSRDQAKDVLRVLQEALHQYEHPPKPKSLPYSVDRKRDAKE